MRNVQSDITIYDATSLPQATFTVVAATDVFTSGAAHGFTIGDKLQFTTATTLPAGLSLLTNYYVITTPSTTTFTVSATPGGSSVDITDTGTGTHTYHLKGRMIFVGDYSNVKIALNFTTTPTMTVKVQGSNQKDSVDCSLAQSATNRWEYIDTISDQSGTSVDGDTGYAVAGAADNTIISVNNDGLEWCSVDCTSWTAGKVSIILSAYSN